jgi:CheY-like chemotaxis protein
MRPTGTKLRILNDTSGDRLGCDARHTISVRDCGGFDNAGPGAKIRGTSVSLLILVVDDEPDVELLFCQHFRRDLRASRFVMEFVQSGPAALQRISDAAGVSLILILSDINMPGMSGLELLPKAKLLRPDVPVIVITAYGDAETKRKALENGAEALLTKPIDFVTLRNEIDIRVERAA